MAKSTTRTREDDVVDGEIIEGTGGAIMQIGDADTEIKWDEWIRDLRETQGAGKITAYKLPLGPDGTPNPSARGSKQIRLSSWPHDQFSLDEIIDIIKRDYLDPGETAGIRLSGTVTGKAGTIFNQIITVKNPRGPTALAVAPQSELVGVMREMREFMNRPTPEPPPPPPSLIQSLTPLMPFLAPILTAAITGYMSRPKPKSELADLIGAMAQLKEFTEGDGERNSGGGDDDSLSSIIKAVAPQGLALLTEMAKRQPMAPIPASGARVVSAVARSNAPNGPGPSIPRRPAPVSPIDSQATVSPTNEVTKEMLAQIAPQLEQLAVMAANGADPKETAVLVMQSFPEDDEADEKLFRLLSNETAFNALKFTSPNVGAQWPWFQALRLALLAEFEDDTGKTE